MRRAHATLIVILLVGTAMTAAASDMVLTRNGELYRAIPTEDGLVVSHRLADGTVVEHLVPQTAGAAITSVQVGVEELTGAIFLAWQLNEELEATVEIVWLVDDTWTGPFTIAGGNGAAAENPKLVIDRVVHVFDDEGEIFELATSFLHITWWGYTETRDDGSAFLASVPLDENQQPLIEEFQPMALRDLLPFGIGCEGISDATGLAHPKMFTDPQSGVPHIFATDFENCVFQILKIDYQVYEEWEGETKRRRHIVLLGHAAMIAANPNIILTNAKVEVGHNLDVVMYWDIEDAISYVQLDEDSIPPVQSLPYDETLTREQAVEMVRSLVH